MCAWSTPSSRTTGDIITAAIWNQDVVNNPNYLKGAAGAVTIQDEVQFANDAAFRVRKPGSNPVFEVDGGDYWQYDRASNVWGFLIGNVETFRIDTNGPINQITGLHLLAGTGAKRHVESGTSAAEVIDQGSDPDEDDAFTFVNTFASNPAVAVGMMHSGTGASDARVIIKNGTLGTSGVTLTKYNNVPGGLTMTTYYIAEGAD